VIGSGHSRSPSKTHLRSLAISGGERTDARMSRGRQCSPARGSCGLGFLRSANVLEIAVAERAPRFLWLCAFFLAGAPHKRLTGIWLDLSIGRGVNCRDGSTRVHNPHANVRV
jgi:hypothetical protein